MNTFDSQVKSSVKVFSNKGRFIDSWWALNKGIGTFSRQDGNAEKDD